jgi:tetratricopeptide (TPR) repeat protein
MLAETLLQAHRPAEAEVLARQAFDGQLKALGPQHPETLNGLNRLGRSLAALGRYDEAKVLYTNVIGQIASTAGAAEPGGNLSKGWYAYGAMAAQSGHPDDAFEHLDQAVALGYHDAESVRYDDDLKPLRGDARFAKLLERLQRG